MQTNNQMALPTKLTDNRAENTIYTIRTTDHITQRSSSLIGSLLVYLSKTYLAFQHKANTLLHMDLKLDKIIFYGKLIVRSNLFSEYPYEKVPNYKNYLVTRNNITYHILLSRKYLGQGVLKNWVEQSCIHYIQIIFFQPKF